MITIQKAMEQHIKGIISVCSEGYRDTYSESHAPEYIERIVRDFYNEDRIRGELMPAAGWDGWFVAIEEGKIVGAGGGGMISGNEAELFVLYLDPARRREGIGTLLLDAITLEQKNRGADFQWVSVFKGNYKGIPFYEAKGFVKHEIRDSYGNSYGENYESIRYRRAL